MSSADSGITLCNERIWTSVDCREDSATSNPALMFAPWKHATSFPPNPKLTTGTRADARPRGSFVPSNDGEGAYVECTGAASVTTCAPVLSNVGAGGALGVYVFSGIVKLP